MKTFRKISLWIFVALLSLGQLQRIELNYIGINIYLHDIFIITWLIQVVFAYHIKYFFYIYSFIKKDKKLQLFLSISLLSLVINVVSNSDLTSLLYFLRLVTYILFGFSLSYLVKKKNIEKEYLKFQIFAVGILSLFLGFLQFIFIKDTRFLAILGWDDHYARLISTYFDPGFTGIIFLITLLIGLSSEYLKSIKIKFITVTFFLWGIILTFSRATYLATISSFLILLLTQIRLSKKLFQQIFSGLTVFAVLLLLAPKPWGEGVNLFRTSTISARTTAIKQQLNELTPQTIILGNGPYSEKNSLNYNLENNNLVPSHSRVPDNIFINVLLSTGVFGLLLFISLLFNWGKKLKNTNPFIFAIFIGILLHTQFNSSLIYPFVLLIFLSGIASNQKL